MQRALHPTGSWRPCRRATIVDGGARQNAARRARPPSYDRHPGAPARAGLASTASRCSEAGATYTALVGARLGLMFGGFGPPGRRRARAARRLWIFRRSAGDAAGPGLGRGGCAHQRQQHPPSECSHRFHTNCLQTWLRFSNTCPTVQMGRSLVQGRPVCSGEGLSLLSGGVRVGGVGGGPAAGGQLDTDGDPRPPKSRRSNVCLDFFRLGTKALRHGAPSQTGPEGGERDGRREGGREGGGEGV